MTLFPPLQIGWLNGWIPAALFFGAFLIYLKVVPQETVKRLYDDSGWTLEQARPARIGLPFALAAMILLPFHALVIGQPIFRVGLALFLVGYAGFFYSLHSFNITPLREPVTDGLYKISRNPQWVAFALILLGISLMVGSWTVLILITVRIIMNHFRILGEEKALAGQYGETYQSYKSQVPRYLLFF